MLCTLYAGEPPSFILSSAHRPSGHASQRHESGDSIRSLMKVSAYCVGNRLTWRLQNVKGKGKGKGKGKDFGPAYYVGE